MKLKSRVALACYAMSATFLPVSIAQNLNCASVAGGCDGGTSYQSAVQAAIARFDSSKIYGGQLDTFSTSLTGGALAMISYSCADTARAPPVLTGSTAQLLLNRILTCPSQCGSVSLPDRGDCGFGILVTSSWSGCWSKSVNLIPKGGSSAVVSAVGDFKNAGCYADSSDARILVADYFVSPGSAGMTVEKCVEFAAASGWQYAGVESGSQCFVGNSLHREDPASSSDCNKVCAGNVAELCGSSNRLQLYKDAAWRDPTADELKEVLLEYKTALADAKTAIEDYKSDVEKLKDLQGKKRRWNGRKHRREDTGPAIAQRIATHHFQKVNAARAPLKGARVKMTRYWKRAASRDITRPSSPLVGDDELIEMDEAFTTAEEHVENVQHAVAEDTALIQRAPPDTVPDLDLAGDVVVSTTAITKIGVDGALGVAVGVFGIMALLLAAIFGGGNGGDSDPPSTPTITTTTTTTSSVCTATATQTPIIILTKKGTSRDQFYDLVASLPKSDENQQFTDPSWPHWMYVATLDECTSEKLWDNPVVQAMTIDNYVEHDGYSTEASSNKKRSAERPRFSSKRNTPSFQANENDDRMPNGTHLESRAVPVAGSLFKLQQNSPNNLEWISSISRMMTLRDEVYGFEGFLYDDAPGRLRHLDAPIVYILDTDFRPDHPDIANRVTNVMQVRQQEVTGHAELHYDYRPTWYLKDPNLIIGGDQSNHGTCMATIAAGSYNGAAKDADLVLVATKAIGPDEIGEPGKIWRTRASRQVVALNAILSDVISKGAQGRSVLSMSFGMERADMWWPQNSQTKPAPPYTDVFQVLLPNLYAQGIVVLCSAGNDHVNGYSPTKKDINYKTPRSTGGRNTPLIVVGNARQDGTRFDTSQYSNDLQSGTLTLYNIGTDVYCGIVSPRLVWNKEPAGTSQATANTAGMVAYYLGDPALRAHFARNGIPEVSRMVKEFLVENGNRFKGDMGAAPDATGATGHGIPRAALGEVVPCREGEIVNLQPQPYDAAPPTTLATTIVASGTQVIFSPLPTCYNFLHR